MGFFSSKPSAPAKQASPQSAPKIVAPRSKPVPPAAPIAITGVGIACHAGEKLYTLITSVVGQMSGTELSDDYAITLNNGETALPRMAPVTSLGSQSSSSRIVMLASSAPARPITRPCMFGEYQRPA